jgi:hypothetical protein
VSRVLRVPWHLPCLYPAFGRYARVADHAISCGTRLALRQAGVRTLNDLERMAMLHPNVARELPARVAAGGAGCECRAADGGDAAAVSYRSLLLASSALTSVGARWLSAGRD